MVAKVFRDGNTYAPRLPDELGPQEGEAQIEVIGDCWVISPIKAKRTKWPRGFFARIRLAEPDLLKRAQQGWQPLPDTYPY